MRTCSPGEAAAGQAARAVAPSTRPRLRGRELHGASGERPQVIVNGPDPGDLGAAEDGEADLDVEWSGAVAKDATIQFVISASTASTHGVDLSAQHIVNNSSAPVMSTSFGLCEADLAASETGFGTKYEPHPHHAAGHASIYGELDKPFENRHILWGALVNGPSDANDGHNILRRRRTRSKRSLLAVASPKSWCCSSAPGPSPAGRARWMTR